MRLCRCGCGASLKRGVKAWASRACVPLSLRAEGGRKGGKVQAMRRNLRMFQDELKRLEACHPMTREDVLVSLRVVYRKGYQAGKFQRLRRVA